MVTSDLRARQVFQEIQSKPYSLAVAPGTAANNCYFKGIELLQRLGVLGYAVRGRVGETYWDRNIIPPEIVDLLPADIMVTHFFPEFLIGENWRIIDPTFQPDLEKCGFIIGSWEGTDVPCFPITKLYTQEESIAYQERWFDPDYQRDFFTRGEACWRALNAWFAKLEDTA
jgi:hypothetical protein